MFKFASICYCNRTVVNGSCTPCEGLLSEYRVMKHMGVGLTATFTLKISSRCRCWSSCTPRPPCLWDRMMAGLNRSFGHNKSVPVSGIKPRSFGFPARSLVTVLNDAQQLAYFLIHFPEAQRFVHNLTSVARSSCHHCHSPRPSGDVNDRLDIHTLSGYHFAFGQFHCRCTSRAGG